MTKFPTTMGTRIVTTTPPRLPPPMTLLLPLLPFLPLTPPTQLPLPLPPPLPNHPPLLPTSPHLPPLQTRTPPARRLTPVESKSIACIVPCPFVLIPLSASLGSPKMVFPALVVRSTMTVTLSLPSITVPTETLLPSPRIAARRSGLAGRTSPSMLSSPMPAQLATTPPRLTSL